jgi:hypothetical protein
VIHSHPKPFEQAKRNYASQDKSFEWLPLSAVNFKCVGFIREGTLNGKEWNMDEEIWFTQWVGTTSRGPTGGRVPSWGNLITN